MEVICFFAVSSVPLTAAAGFFNFVSELFADEITEQMPVHNVQNMPLLQAVPNPDFDNHPDLAIVDDSVLEAHAGPLGTPLEIEEQAISDRVIVYKVRAGDNLASVAKMFNVSPNTIAWANDGRRVLRVGDELTILPVSGIKYIVKKGDTLAGIAKSFKADAEEIARFNDLDGALISGTQIIIPDGEITPVAIGAAKKPTAAAPAGAVGYFIRPTTGRLTQGPHGPGLSAVDIANKPGTAVVAAAAGKVIVAKSSGYNGGFGNYIVIEHRNGLQTLYAHLSSVGVAAGAVVGQGDYIGAMGMTGKATGFHLHFKINGGPYGWNPFSK